MEMHAPFSCSRRVVERCERFGKIGETRESEGILLHDLMQVDRVVKALQFLDRNGIERGQPQSGTDLHLEYADSRLVERAHAFLGTLEFHRPMTQVEAQAQVIVQGLRSLELIEAGEFHGAADSGEAGLRSSAIHGMPSSATHIMSLKS